MIDFVYRQSLERDGTLKRLLSAKTKPVTKRYRQFMSLFFGSGIKSKNLTIYRYIKMRKAQARVSFIYYQC